MFHLTATSYKKAGEFLPGELAYDAENASIYLCVETNTHSPQAFRRLFAAKGERWETRFGDLSRFGYNREMQSVKIDTL